MAQKSIGKYDLLKFLGSGATAEVYQARDNSLDREVALKVLKAALVVDPESFARFQKEAQAAAKLFHPHIASVLDMGEAEGRYYIAMLYHEGRPLDRLLAEEGPQPWERARQMAGQIGAALDFAHLKGFLHRDIKPSNIICAQDGGFVLTDFGLTRAMMSTGMTSHSAAMVGTPPYMAPEVWSGAKVSAATDMYALACVFYEMLTGQVLFAGETPPVVMTRHVLEGPQFPKQWPQGTPAGIESILRQALAKDPIERYPSAGAFAEALEALAKPVVKREETPPIRAAEPKPALRVPPPAKQASKAPLVWAGVIVMGALIGIAGLGFIISWLLRGSETSNAPTELPLQIADATPVEPSTATPTDALEEIRDAEGVIMRLVPAGAFTMGGSADTAFAECQNLYVGGECQRDWFTEEEPAHTVSLDAFYMDKYEVSNAAYRACVQSGACQPPTDAGSHTRSSYYGNSDYDHYPVLYVDWNMANAYCDWRGARLPTEAEWEKAARGPDGRLYPWGNSFDGSKANFCDTNCDRSWANKKYNDGYADTAPVDAFPSGASMYGILNLAGNVWEWTADWYDSGYYGNSPSSNPSGPASGESRVVRGGSWYGSGDFLRPADRGGDDPSNAYYALGFRCALSQ